MKGNKMRAYKNLCTELYDLDKPHPPEDAFNFYMNHAKNSPGPILEAMCGTGRFLIPMLEQGIELEGLDASSHMLSACKRKCAEKNLKPKLYHEELLNMSLDKKYGLIFIPSGSFSLVADTYEAKLCLETLYKHLLPNGHLIFEVEIHQAVPTHLGYWQRGAKSHERWDGAKIVLNTFSLYDKEKQILQTECLYELVKDHKIIETETEELQLRLYKEHEVEPWLKEIGFTKVKSRKGYSDELHDKNHDSMIYE